MYIKLLTLIKFVAIVATIFTITQVRTGDGARLCGRKLTDALASLCHGQYQPIIKRSDIADELYNDAGENYEDATIYYHPFLNKLIPNGALKPRVRRNFVTTKGVYDECCLKSCTFTELSSYCAS